MTQRGFADLNDDDLVNTTDLAWRLGFDSLRAWYRSAQRRKDAGFPAPQRRGYWRAGCLKAWFGRGGFNQECSSPSKRLIDAPAAPSSPAEKPANDQPAPPETQGGARPEFYARLAARRAAR